MKRIFSVCLLFAMLMPFISLGAEAAGQETIVAYFDDGSYITETLVENGVRSSATKEGTKTRTYYGASGDTKWKAVLSGTFEYNGKDAECTAASVDVDIYDSSWYVISKSASRSRNTAYGDVVLGERVLGVTVSEVDVNLTLTCDPNGNLS